MTFKTMGKRSILKGTTTRKKHFQSLYSLYSLTKALSSGESNGGLVSVEETVRAGEDCGSDIVVERAAGLADDDTGA